MRSGDPVRKETRKKERTEEKIGYNTAIWTGESQEFSLIFTLPQLEKKEEEERTENIPSLVPTIPKVPVVPSPNRIQMNSKRVVYHLMQMAGDLKDKSWSSILMTASLYVTVNLLNAVIDVDRTLIASPLPSPFPHLSILVNSGFDPPSVDDDDDDNGYARPEKANRLPWVQSNLSGDYAQDVKRVDVYRALKSSQWRRVREYDGAAQTWVEKKSQLTFYFYSTSNTSTKLGQ